MLNECFIVKHETGLHLPAALRNGRGVFNRYARLWMEVWLAGLDLPGLLEAMAYGNCVQVSDIEKNLEAVAGNGVSFEAKNVDDLKNKLEFLMRNPVMVQEYGEKARRQAAEAYDWEAITSQFETLYVELLRGK